MTLDKKIFSGIWHTIHVTGVWADSSERFIFFCKWLRLQVENLPCEDCRKHAREYLQHNPPEKSEDAFIYTWRFHNAVNKRLGKPEMDYDTAKNLYLYGNIKQCTNCFAK